MSDTLASERFGITQHDAVDAHYDKIADNFDTFFGFWYNPMAEVMAKYLDLKPTDWVADIGAGTGGVAHSLWKNTGLQSPVLAIEPNGSLLQKAQGKEGIEILQATADDFTAHPNFPDYNKIFMSHSAHHLPDPVTTFKTMLQRMTPDARCVVVYYPENNSMLLWKAAIDMFNKHPHDMSKPMIDAGMAVEVHRANVSYKVTKAFWYHRLRGRVYSPLEMLTDEQIEAGIAELEATRLKGVAMEEEFEMKEVHMVSVGTSPR